jgi:hypothetical protein
MVLIYFVQERKPANVPAVMESLEPSMTSEIAKELGWPRRTTYEVLNRLAEEGGGSQEEA